MNLSERLPDANYEHGQIPLPNNMATAAKVSKLPASVQHKSSKTNVYQPVLGNNNSSNLKERPQ